MEVEMSKKCTPLWREAHFQVKSVKKLTVSDHLRPLLEAKMMEKWTPLWREANFQVKHTMLGPLLEVDMSKKCTQLWRKAHFEVKSAKIGVWSTFGRSDVVLRGRRKGFCMFA